MGLALVYDIRSRGLSIEKTTNVKSPVVDLDKVVLMTVDVWEHTYESERESPRLQSWEYVSTLTTSRVGVIS